MHVKYAHWLLFGLIVAAVYTMRFVTSTQLGVSNDDALYIVLAESFATGRPYRLINYPHAPLQTIWPPGYPLLVLAPLWLLVGPSYDLLRASSLFLAFANIVLLYRVLRPLAPQPLPTLAVMLFGVHHFVAAMAGMAMSESAYLFASLGFVLLFRAWTNSSKPLNWLGLSVVLTLVAAFLIRYAGIVLLGAAVIYLLLQQRYRWTALLLVGFAVCLVPFGLFLATARLDAPESLSALAIAQNQVATLAEKALISLTNYARTIPLLLIPVLGPRASGVIKAAGLGWSVDVVHLVILAVVMLGLIRGLLKRDFIALYVVCYFLMLFGFTQGTSSRIFNETRYAAAALPFLYFYLLQGVSLLARAIPKQALSPRTVTVLVSALLLVVLLLRNVQQARAEFPVADLSIGAAWLRANAPEKAVVMAPDPVSRYLYLRRKTVNYPESAGAPEFWAKLAEHNVQYLLLAPPLRLNEQANVGQAQDPGIHALEMSVIRANPDCFVPVYRDEEHSTAIYELVKECPQLHARE